MLDETRNCASSVTAEVDRQLHTLTREHGWAGWTGRRLRLRVKSLILQAEADLEPAATAQRQHDARQARRVCVSPEPDAMASLWALLPADQLRGFSIGLDELHRRQLLADRAAGIERTADQRRADLLALLPVHTGRSYPVPPYWPPPPPPDHPERTSQRSHPSAPPGSRSRHSPTRSRHPHQHTH